MAAGASFIVAPGFDPEVCKHVIDKGGIMMPGTCSAGEMQQAMNMGCEALKFFPAEANGGVGMLKNIGAALKSARWMCTGGVNAKNVNDYLGYDQIFAVGGTWMCKSDVIKAHDWAKITAQSKEAVDTMLGLKLMQDVYKRQLQGSAGGLRCHYQGRDRPPDGRKSLRQLPTTGLRPAELPAAGLSERLRRF